MYVILNPMARNGSGRRLRPAIERALERAGIGGGLTVTEGPGHAAELAHAAAAGGARVVVAAGGDGTVHDVANGILSAGVHGCALGVIPVGTGNDFVKMIPGTATLDQAVATLAGGRAAACDVGRATWDGGAEYFINAMGTGIDVEVVRAMRRVAGVPGGVLYVAALVRALVHYRALAAEVAVDGVIVRQRIMNLAVCNGPSIGGVFRICPEARPDDGIFDVCLVGELPILRNVAMVPRVLRGTHVGRRGITMLAGRSIEVRLRDAGPMFFQLDGELREARDGGLGVRVEIEPGRLNVIRHVA